MTNWILFCFGLITGSFLNLCIHRLPRGISIVTPRSRCPRCRHEISAGENLPVVSWIFLRGRCRGCGQYIPVRYPLTELACGAGFYAAAAHFGTGALFVKFTFFLISIVLLTATDIEMRQLPDEVTLGGLAVGLAFAWWVAPVSAPGSTGWLALAAAVTGAIIGGGLLWLVGAAYRFWRGREGMGMGDIKMMAMVGAFLGPLPTVITLVFASIFGACIGVLLALILLPRRLRRARRRGIPWGMAWRSARCSTQVYFSRLQMPFGVFLGIAALLAWFWGEAVWKWYLQQVLLRP